MKRATGTGPPNLALTGLHQTGGVQVGSAAELRRPSSASLDPLHSSARFSPLHAFLCSRAPTQVGALTCCSKGSPTPKSQQAAPTCSRGPQPLSHRWPASRWEAGCGRHALNPVQSDNTVSNLTIPCPISNNIARSALTS